MWRKAIENHKTLMKERTDSSFWSDNIIDATACLKEEDDWKKFYLYLTNSPVFFDKENPTVVPTLGELSIQPTVPKYQSNQHVEVVENGSDRYITVSTIVDGSSDDDEKHPE